MACKRLIIVVDSAAELKSHWQDSIGDLLAGIVRYLYRTGSTSQVPGPPKPYLGLTVYSSKGPCIEPQILPWGWTNDEDTFIEWLSAVHFTGGDYCEAAVSIALATACKTIADARDSSEAQVFGQTHCILVTSYKSLPLPNLGNQKLDRFLFDGAAAARNFVQSFVSLSIISPKHSPRLKEIFKAGNVYQPRAAYSSDDRQKFSYLILLSDNFMGLPIDQLLTSLEDRLSEIEACLLDSDSNDDIKRLQENGGQRMASFQDVLNGPMVSPHVHGGNVAFVPVPKDGESTMSSPKVKDIPKSKSVAPRGSGRKIPRLPQGFEAYHQGSKLGTS